jgi:hypothetical protein
MDQRRPGDLRGIVLRCTRAICDAPPAQETLRMALTKVRDSTEAHCGNRGARYGCSSPESLSIASGRPWPLERIDAMPVPTDRIKLSLFLVGKRSMEVA